MSFATSNIFDYDGGRLPNLFGKETNKVLKVACAFVENRDKETLGKLYKIVQHYHIRAEWSGFNKDCCMPDRFVLYRYGKRIGYIQC